MVENREWWKIMGLQEDENAQWFSVPEVAEKLRIRLRDVRAMLARKEIVALRRGVNNALLLHESQFIDSAAGFTLVPGLKGTFTVLADGGYSDEEMLAWMLTPNTQLATTPINALRAGRIHAVRTAILTSMN
ncbi:Rv2175c family DNA-binding protein [Arcanobacterium hippocoleae]|uniref:Rv2175c C-terminal domain-containing protein n=1 Tax=Arcanobacterium hippocoleae TaxID=149017 RepID=A0ABU1T0H4_9ACTO|nr:Rv2175c family DNA-binding protein [Arcanobacterium hippocoleae]MDR6938872.1 hypothetical protein [Arcanobacterium hippocoleae]